MVVLQKAYADIILNTAKEAAARIMVSEKKALRSQLDLSNTKEESLRMLVYLKQTIDSKTIEAQVTSSTQQRKIDELEAQLNEAEDVITDLRAELKWVRHKMEKVKDSQMQAMDEQITKEETYFHNAVAVKPIIPSTCNSGPETITAPDIGTSLNQRISGISCCSASQHLGITQKDNCEDHSSTIASIITRSKMPEQCRNGCTQRNHAFERNLPDRKLPPLGDADGQDSVIKNEIEMNDQETGTCILTSPKYKPLGMAKNLSGEVTKKPAKFRKLRRIKSRFGKAKATIRKSHRSKPIKSRQVSSIISHCKTYIVSDIKSEVSTCSLPSTDAGDMAISSSTVYDVLQRNSNSVEDKSVLIFKRKDDMNAQGSDATASSFASSPDLLVHPSQPSSVINFNPVYAFTIHGNTKYGEAKLKITESEAKMRPLPRLDPGLTFVRRGVNPVSGSKNGSVSVKTLNKSRIFKNDGGKELKRDSDSLTQDVENSESSMVVCSKLRPKMFESPVKQSDAKDTKLFSDTNESPNKFKYTFQRKRKKGSLKTDDDASPERHVVKRRSAEKQNDAPEEQSSLIYESSKDRRQLAEVARQLISLAGRSW